MSNENNEDHPKGWPTVNPDELISPYKDSLVPFSFEAKKGYSYEVKYIVTPREDSEINILPTINGSIHLDDVGAFLMATDDPGIVLRAKPIRKRKFETVRDAYEFIWEDIYLENYYPDDVNTGEAENYAKRKANIAAVEGAWKLFNEARI